MGKIYFPGFDVGGWFTDDFIAYIENNKLIVKGKNDSYNQAPGEYTITTFDNLKLPKFQEKGGLVSIPDFYNSIINQDYIGEWIAYSKDLKYKYHLTLNQDLSGGFKEVDFAHGYWRISNGHLMIGTTDGVQLDIKDKTPESFVLIISASYFFNEYDKLIVYKKGSVLQKENERLHKSKIN